MLDKEVKLVADILYVGRERTDSSCLPLHRRSSSTSRSQGGVDVLLGFRFDLGGNTRGNSL